MIDPGGYDLPTRNQRPLLNHVIPRAGQGQTALLKRGLHTKNEDKRGTRVKHSGDASRRTPFPIFGSRDTTHQQVCVPVLRGRYFPYLGNSVHGVRSCSGYLSWRVLVPLSGSLDEPDGLSLSTGKCIRRAMLRCALQGFKENFRGSHCPSLLRHRRRDSPDGYVCDRLRLCRCRDYRRQPAKLHHHRNSVPAHRRGLVLPPLAEFASVWSSARLTSRREHGAVAAYNSPRLPFAAVNGFADGFGSSRGLTMLVCTPDAQQTG